jgi:hypothetical protein
MTLRFYNPCIGFSQSPERVEEKVGLGMQQMTTGTNIYLI